LGPRSERRYRSGPSVKHPQDSFPSASCPFSQLLSSPGRGVPRRRPKQVNEVVELPEDAVVSSRSDWPGENQRMYATPRRQGEENGPDDNLN
jgi:hypothetical protein